MIMPESESPINSKNFYSRKLCALLEDQSIAFPVRKRYIVDGEKLHQQRFECATQV